MVEAVLRSTPEITERSWQASRDVDVLVLSTFAALGGVPTARRLRIPAVVAHVMSPPLAAGCPRVRSSTTHCWEARSISPSASPAIIPDAMAHFWDKHLPKR